MILLYMRLSDNYKKERIYSMVWFYIGFIGLFLFRGWVLLDEIVKYIKCIKVFEILINNIN